jgi:signal transduction histidine kinase
MIWRWTEIGWRVLPGSIVSLLFAGLLKLGALQPFEQAAYNTLFRLRGEQNWDDRLVLVAIDDASIRKLGRFPWPRQRYVALFNRLQQAESSVVVVDLVWSERSPDDAKLAQAIEQHGQVVLAQAQDSNGIPLVPVPELQKAAIGTGHIFKPQDTDGITRSIPPQVQEVPALGLATVQSYSLVRSAVPLPNLDKPLWVNWVGRSQRLRQYSFADVVEGKVAAADLQNKLIVVGVTATGIDSMVSPFDRDPPTSGVFLQATLIHNLLQQNSLQAVSGYWLVLLLGGPVLSLVMARWREEWQVLTWIGLGLIWGGVSLLLLRWGYWVPVVLPIGLVTTTTGAVVIGERLRVNALLKQQVRQLWQRYQPDLVLANIQSPKFEPSYRATGSTQSLAQITALADQFGRSQSTQSAIARSLSVGLLAADQDDSVWFCNPVASNLLQITVGCDLQSSLVPAWVTLPQWQSDRQTLQQRRFVEPRELERGDRWFALKLEPLTYRSFTSETSPAALDGFLLLLEDITTRKQAEAALALQVQELQRLSQLKDDFLSTVSHELRAPMTNIKMLIEVLKLGYSEQNRDTYLNHLERECNREIDLINDLLDLQRLEAGYQTFQPRPIDLREWVPMVVETFNERVEVQNQRLQIEVPDRCPHVFSDPHSLERILVELVNNACKYTPPEALIQVCLDCTATQVEIAVSNFGSEIPAAELPRIFEKFYRVPQGDRWKRGGTGLGLALVKKLVESINGTIEATSANNLTVFTVRLPLGDAGEDQNFDQL